VGHHGERVAVRGGRGALARPLLGREVGHGAEHHAGLRDARLPRRRGDPEVPDGEAVVLVEQQVARLDVAVDDALGVRVVQRRAGLLEPAQRQVLGDGPLAQALADGARRDRAP
jgi:hypothetical protein